MLQRGDTIPLHVTTIIINRFLVFNRILKVKHLAIHLNLEVCNNVDKHGQLRSFYAYDVLQSRIIIWFALF